MDKQAAVRQNHATLIRQAGGQALQRAAIDETLVEQAPPIVHEVLRAGGQPLDDETRASMESRFGYDFSGVRVHTGPKAAESARAVNALAYTVGRDVVFGAGQYAPASGQGQRLLSHELTHVAQQQAGPAAPSQALTVGPADDPLEREAQRAAEFGPHPPRLRAVAEQHVTGEEQRRPLPTSGHSRSATGQGPGIRAMIQRQSIFVPGAGLGQPSLTGINIATETVDLEGSETLSAQNPKLVALARSFKATESGSPGATLKLSADLTEAAQTATAKETEERSRLNRRLLDARDALATLGVSKDQITIQAPTAYSTSAHGQITAAIYKAPTSMPFIMPPGPIPAPGKVAPGPGTGGGGLPDLSKLLTLKFGPLTVELPKSATLKLPIAITQAKTLTIELKAETSATFSFSLTLDGLPHIRVSVKSSVSYSKEKGTTGTAGLQIEATRTVCSAANPDALRTKVTKAGEDLKKAMGEFSAESDNAKKLSKAADIASALGDMYDAVDKSKEGCKQVPAVTFEFGAKVPFGGGTETDPSKREPGYIGPTVTIPF